MNPSLPALLVALCAGLSALLGGLAVYLRDTDTKKIITASLGFAAGLTVCVSMFELFPEAVEAMSQSYTGLKATLIPIGVLLLGVLCGALLDKIIPHHGCAHPEEEEHAHHHPHTHHHHKDCKEDALYHTGIATMLGLALHNLPEGAALFLVARENLAAGITMAVAIALHSIPEGIAVAMPIYVSTGSRLKAFGHTLLAGLAMPLGALLAWLVIIPFSGAVLLGLANAFVAGIMMYIALYELLPGSRAYGLTRLALWSTIVGICAMPLTHMFHHH